MRWATALLLALCACNQVFDLRSTKAIDARRDFFDAPLDAPYACPATGETPAFAPLFHQVIVQNCKDYAASQARHTGIALCDDQYSGNYLLSDGPIDGPLTEIPGFVDPLWFLQYLRASADGDELFAMYYSAGYQVRTFRRTTGGWERRPDFFDTAGYLEFSHPTNGPVRHAMHIDTTGKLLEFTEDAVGNWTQIDSYTAAQLGIDFPGSPSLSGDGLRLMLYGRPGGGAQHLAYTDRASLTDRFGPVRRLEGVPFVRDAMMTDDCSRVYFSGLESIFYVQRL
ncbi:MAG TPA: hypothetical protein VLB44_21660 [Kofleriaceae bacterium]|nr:hypothetical protein [Kofleriaceae bacterium]